MSSWCATSNAPEDIAPAALAAGIDWTWTSFAEYLDTLDRIPKGINYAANIGHSALRTYVMGERAFEGEATDDDLAAMKAELSDALHAGAYGFTTSRTVHHQTSDDRPVASRLASWDEVVQLVEVLGDLGAGIFQIVSDPSPPGDARQGRAVPRPLAHDRRPGRPRGDERCHARDSSTSRQMPARGSGASPIRVGSARSRRSAPSCHSTGCRSGVSFVRCPVDEQQRRLRDPEVVARLVKIADEGPYGAAFGGEARPPEFDRMRVFDSPVPPNPTVAEAAAARDVHPVELMIQLALETDMRQLFWQTFSPFDYDRTLRCLRHPNTVMGFSDSGAHVSQMSDASIETHLLAHFVRDRQRLHLGGSRAHAHARARADVRILRSGPAAGRPRGRPQRVRPGDGRPGDA